MIVTIIGSRKTPKNILKEMQKCAHWFMCNGYIVRSGGADGADMVVDKAWLHLRELTNKVPLEHDDYLPYVEPEIYIPWKGFGKHDLEYMCMGDSTKAREIAENIHPAWDRCSRGAKALHTRNVCQILGYNIKTPSNVVLYWCPEKNGKPTGGTATAVNLAKKYNIPTVNMLHNTWKEQLRTALNI